MLAVLLTGVWGSLDAAAASGPSPSDGAGNVSIRSDLSWSAGGPAPGTVYDLYLGTDYQDVYNRDESVYVGLLDETTYDPDSLVSGTVYYWAVDEIDPAYPDDPWFGPVWSFWTTHEGYYKDLFMDGGVSLTSRTVLPAADYLDLTMEYLATSDQDLQDRVIVGAPDDANGRLLYPDGQPRFRCIYVNGGSSIYHGASLGEAGLQRIRDFYYNGGSYTGSCAGSAISTIRVATSYSVTNRPEYFRLWPGRAHYTDLADSYTGMSIPPGSPLLDYYDFGGDNYVAHVRHNVGNYTIEGDPFFWSPQTEALATYAEPIEGADFSYQPFIGNVSTWAHKHDSGSGRLVVIGGHPESITYGDRRQLTAAIYQYALAGTGLPKVKAALQNAVTRYMDNNDYPGHERIGDKQFHHFTVVIPPGMSHLTISLDGDDVHDLDLFARKDDFAFRGKPGIIEAVNNTSSDEVITIDNPAAGLWYIGIKGYTTVKTSGRSWGQDYVGNLEVLDGMPYSISAFWDAPYGDLTVDGLVDIHDLVLLVDQYFLQSYAPDPDSPLMAHWKFDEVAGGFAYDSSGKGHTGLVACQPIWKPSTGRFDGALSCDEVDDFVRVIDFDYTNASHEFTVSFWFKIDNVAGSGYQYMFSHNDYNADNSLNIYFRESGINTNPESVSMRLRQDDGAYWHYTHTSPHADGDWHMYTLTVSATLGSVVYIDGTIASANPGFLAGSYDPASDIFIAGRANLDPDRHFGHYDPDDGLIDDVRLYDYALNASEITSLYSGSFAAPVHATDICRAYPLGDLNEDGRVDLLDFALIAEQWLK